jgi:hypothetical protein
MASHLRNGEITLEIQNLAGDIYPVTIHPNQTVEKLKEHISEQKNEYKVGKQKLFIPSPTGNSEHPMVLENYKLIRNYPLQDGTTVFLVINEQSGLCRVELHLTAMDADYSIAEANRSRPVTRGGLNSNNNSNNNNNNNSNHAEKPNYRGIMEPLDNFLYDRNASYKINKNVCTVESFTDENDNEIPDLVITTSSGEKENSVNMILECTLPTNKINTSGMPERNTNNFRTYSDQHQYDMDPKNGFLIFVCKMAYDLAIHTLQLAHNSVDVNDMLRDISSAMREAEPHRLTPMEAKIIQLEKVLTLMTNKGVIVSINCENKVEGGRRRNRRTRRHRKGRKTHQRKTRQRK